MKYAAALAFTISLYAQVPDFNVQTRLVLVPATVTDGKGQPVDGLGFEDFLVLDNGRPQRVVVDTIATGVAPLALMVAVQSSGISTVVLEKVRKVSAMVQPLITGDRGCAGLISFAEKVRVLQDCTRDPDAFERAFFQLKPGDEKSACMLDAVEEAINRLRQRPNTRRVLLLISETRDRGSKPDLEQILVNAQAAGITVYSATYSAFKTAFTSKSSATGAPRAPKVAVKPSDQTGNVTGAQPNRTQPSLPNADQRVDFLGLMKELSRMGQTNTTQALAAATGGITFPFTRQKGLEAALEKLGVEMNSQYLLSFTPESPVEGYHHIEVQVKDSSREAHVRARPGYWPQSQ